MFFVERAGRDVALAHFQSDSTGPGAARFVEQALQQPGPPSAAPLGLRHREVGQLALIGHHPQESVSHQRGPFDEGPGGPGGWWILDEPELHLGNQVVVPDLAGWRRERLPAVPEEAHFSLAPDWICEVLSPSNRVYDLTVKRRFYAEIGVPHLWYIDLEARTLTVNRLHDGQWSELVYRGGACVRAEPFDAVEIDLAQWWSRAGAVAQL